MRARTRALVAVALAVAAAGLSAPPASATQAAARISIFEGVEFEPGGPLVLDWGYAPGNASVPSGATVRWTNPAQNFDPHTVTVVRAAQVPQTADEVFACFGGICGQVAERHFGAGEPVRLLNTGRTGLNRSGDSRLLFPGQTVFATVTAPAGTTLHYICALHPWMQAKLTVT